MQMKAKKNVLLSESVEKKICYHYHFLWPAVPFNEYATDSALKNLVTHEFLLIMFCLVIETHDLPW